MSLNLRPLTPDDAAATADLITPGVSRWTGSWPEQVTPQAAGERIARTLAASAAGLSLFRVMERSEDNALMGWIGLTRAAPDARVASLGYWIGEPFWGRRYVGEAARAFLDVAWAEWDIGAVEAEIQLGNAASLAIARRLGMEEIGERLVYASARDRRDLCKAFRLERPASA
jgi:ribosomal-protein-alanine N-acetyltransferase